jgi:hypothetical protein
VKGRRCRRKRLCLFQQSSCETEESIEIYSLIENNQFSGRYSNCVPYVKKGNKLRFKPDSGHLGQIPAQINVLVIFCGDIFQEGK